MPDLVTCPQGHRWEAADADCSVGCPVCGAAHVTSSGGDSLGTAGPTFIPATGAPQVASAPAVTPSIPGYEVLSVLGRGGMGVVYKARQTSLNREVALKVLLAGAQASPEMLARFRTEAEAVARLQHPNIVQVYEVGEAAGCPYLCLELVEGPSLDKQFAGVPQPPRPAAELVRALARAMHYAHEQGILHRDLKPANILLLFSREPRASADGCGQDPSALARGSRLNEAVPKITDFGLAKRLGTEAGPTRTGDVMGTPSYMAPEQAGGVTKRVGPAADVYALGAILYEALTGRPPFLGENPVETVLQVLSVEPVSPRRLQPRLPRELETICLKCLAKTPGRRYPDAGALADDLERFLDGRPILARPAGVWERGVKWARRRPALAALLLVLAVAPVVLAGGFAWHSVQLRAERDQTEARFRTALAALGQIIRTVEPEVDEVPRTDTRALLATTLKFYQELQQNLGDDPAQRRELGQAYVHVADILRKLGRSQQAEEAYRQAIHFWGRLVAEDPRAAEDRQQLAYCQNYLGEVLRTTSRLPEATAAYRQAIDLQEALVADFPAEPAYLPQLALSHNNLGLVLKDTGQLADAEREFRRTTALYQNLVDRVPGDPAGLRGLAFGWLNLGTVLRKTGRPNDAEAAYGRAVAIYRDLVDLLPRKPDYRDELARAFTNQGNLLIESKRPSEARAAFDQALKLRRQLVADFPQVPTYRQELANAENSRGSMLAAARDWTAAREAWHSARDQFAHLAQDFPDTPVYRAGLGMALGNLGWLLLKQDQPAEARRYLESGIDHLRAALRPNPSLPDYRDALRRGYWNLADTLLRLQDSAGAARAALELPALYTDHGQGCYVAATFLARCAAAAEAAGPAADAERYAGDALRLLREARREGYGTAERVKTSAAFQALRWHGGFRQFLEESSKPPG